MVFFHSRDGYWELIGYQAHLSASVSSLPLFFFLFSVDSASLSGPPHMLCVTSCIANNSPTFPGRHGGRCHRSVAHMCTRLMESSGNYLLWTFFSKTVRFMFLSFQTSCYLALSTLFLLTLAYPFFLFLLSHPPVILRDSKHFKLTLISPLSMCLFTSSHLSALIIIRYDCVCWCCLGKNMGCQESSDHCWKSPRPQSLVF